MRLSRHQADMLAWIMEYADSHVDEHGRRKMPHRNELVDGLTVDCLIKKGYLAHGESTLVPTAKAAAWWARRKRSRRKLFLEVKEG